MFAEVKQGAAQRPPVAWIPLALVGAGVLALHLACLTQYGWFRDELYYLSCAKRLAWGYVDQPPFSIAVLALLRWVAGERLGVLRLVAALLGLQSLLLTALIARELGGRRFAQTLAAAAIGTSPIALGIAGYYSMNAFDVAFWALATLLALRALREGSRATWAALGLVLGLGLLNKWSVGWLGVGLAVGLALSPRRAVLRTSRPWLAVALAAVTFAPNVLWEIRHHWPTLEFMHNASAGKMAAFDLGGFLLGQLLSLGPAAALVWVAGLVVSLAPGRPSWRLLGVIYFVTLAILLANGSARVEYLTLAVPPLAAAGAVWWEARARPLRLAVAALVVALALPLVPFALPILPVPSFVAWQKALHVAPKTEERHRMGALPQHYADMFGWRELADSVARVAATLTPDQRSHAIVVVGNYGEAGALERFGRHRIPTVACQHNNWFLWGPPQWDGSIGIFVGRDSSEVAGEFDRAVVAGRAGHPLAMPYEQDLPIVIGHGFHPDLAQAWAKGKHYQ